MRAGRIRAAYRRLLRYYGPQGWWPGRDELEIWLGAILTQGTSWKNVERALRNLEEAGGLAFERLARIPERGLAGLLRPSGYYNQKARKVRAFLRFLRERCGGDARRLAHRASVRGPRPRAPG